MAFRFLLSPFGLPRRNAEGQSREINPAPGVHDLCVRKPFSSPRNDGVGFEPSNGRQVHRSISFAFNFKPYSHAPISLTFAAGNPAAIFWRVWAVIVDAVDHHAGRTYAHIRHEIRKRIPSLANLDSSAAVILPLRVVRIVASAPHTPPKTVKRMRILEWHSRLPLLTNTITHIGNGEQIAL